MKGYIHINNPSLCFLCCSSLFIFLYEKIKLRVEIYLNGYLTFSRYTHIWRKCIHINNPFVRKLNAIVNHHTKMCTIHGWRHASLVSSSVRKKVVFLKTCISTFRNTFRNYCIRSYWKLELQVLVHSAWLLTTVLLYGKMCACQVFSFGEVALFLSYTKY